MIKKKTFSINLKVQVEIDGKQPSDVFVKEKIIEALKASFPSLILHDEDLDVLIFTESFEFEKVKK